MFEQFAEPARPKSQKSSRAQILYAAFFGTGALLNVICNLSGPHHTHRPTWISLHIAALVLMLVGSLIGLTTFAKQRSGKRQSSSLRER